jgi:hypothetical protein
MNEDKHYIATRIALLMFYFNNMKSLIFTRNWNTNDVNGEIIDFNSSMRRKEDVDRAYIVGVVKYVKSIIDE